MSLIQRIVDVILQIGTDMNMVLSRLVKEGGAEGQVYTKKSSAPFDAEWRTLSGGGGGAGVEMAFDVATYTDDDGNQVTGSFTGVMQKAYFGPSAPVQILGVNRDQVAFLPPTPNESMGFVFAPATINSISPGDTHLVFASPGVAQIVVDGTYGGGYTYARIKKIINGHDDVLEVSFENAFAGVEVRNLGLDGLGRPMVKVPASGVLNVLADPNTFSVYAWGDTIA